MSVPPPLAIWGDDGPSVSRAYLLDLIRRHLLPFLSEAEVDTRLSDAESGGLAGCDFSSGTRYEPVQALHDLFHGFPAFFEDRELRLLSGEPPVVDSGDETVGGTRSFVLRQEATVRLSEIPEVGGLTLWIPAPRHMPGVQDVRLVGCDPPAVREYYVPEAGQFYAIPLLLHPMAEAPPRLHVEFHVSQCLDRLRTPSDPDLVALNPGAGGDVSLVAPWVHRLRVSPAKGAAMCVQAVVRAMERSFRFTVHGPMSPKMLVALGAGNVETLTSFLSAALRCLGFATRCGAAQHLMMEADRTQLRYPASVAYEHRFLQWRYSPTDERGVVDLTYWERWSFAANARNTRSEAFRRRLTALGGWGAARLRQGLYHGDLVVAGIVPSSCFVNFNSYDTGPVAHPVDTEISAVRES